MTCLARAQSHGGGSLLWHHGRWMVATGDHVQSGVTLVGVHLRVMLGSEWMMEVEVSCTLRYATAGNL